MHDPIERAFQQLQAPHVPEGPPDELVEATLHAVVDESRRLAELTRRRRRRLSMAVAAAAVIVIACGVTWYAIHSSNRQHIRHEAESRPPLPTPSADIAGAFIEAEHLEPGQTFLLPLHGSAVRVDPATWPDDLLTIRSTAEL